MSFQPHNRANYIRRKAVSAMMNGLCSLAAAIGLVVLALILFVLLQKGAAGLSLDVFTHSMKTPGQGGGLSNAIVGTLIQVALGIAMGGPLGIMVGVYLSEVGRTGRFATLVRFVNDVLLTAPSVLIGLFVYQVVVVPFGGFSGFAGGVALALLAMPVVARTTEDILKLVPDTYRDASTALGARESVTIWKVVLPAGFSGILTGLLLAVARIAGETAPLIVTSFGSVSFTLNPLEPMHSLPMAIYRYASSPYEEWVQLGWTGALIVTFGVLILNVISRLGHAYVSRGRSG
jgi:phosphate transport system permease protein